MNKLSLALSLPFALGLASLGTGCGGYTRTPDQWTEDTYKVLESQNDGIKKCYAEALKKNANLEGKVTVSFVVENKTGRIRRAKVDGAKTTAGDPVRRCVLEALKDQRITPPDANNGRATFTWEFKRNIVKTDDAPPAT